ncbi:hypothetical protein ACGFNU_38225 [Spirillospora sp. NPDC048911]|uniref:hypothetical protein n=1 Tax=Spirillospora sp. NPDC048911 TaxID=3364527 RepID=UPI00371BB046
MKLPSRRLGGLATSVALAIGLLTPGTAHAAAWHPVPLPFLWWQNRILDIAASAPDNVWIGGLQGFIPALPLPASYGNPVVRRWNGSSWKEYPLNGWSGQGSIYQVAARPGEVWVTGDKYFARFDGTAFQKVTPPPNIRDIEAGASGVYAMSYTDNTLYKWNGSGWDASPLVPNAKWTGDRYETVDPPAAEPVIVAANGSSGLYAVTDLDLYDDIAPRLWHKTGGDWSQVTLPAGLTIRTITQDGTGRIWAAAEPSNQYTLHTFDGTTWTKQFGPSRDGIEQLVAVPGTGTVWGRGFGAPWGDAQITTNA